MSAAEKLRALDKLLAPPQFGTPDQLYVYDEVRRVLPQIVAVVSAAEEVRGIGDWVTQTRLPAALAALDEKLGEK